MAFLLEHISDAFLITLEDLYKPVGPYKNPAERLRYENRIMFLCMGALILLLLGRALN